ncbi:MAG: hypothetical protein J6Y95_02970, partial [Lachnospiraceae bacterium]|nr:hypothetical protein [Lachnospiraceae bacterium]
YDLYMNAIGECYEGSEVKDLIEQIVHNCISIQPKTKRIKETRQQISQLFHTTDGKRPNWIQGPDWPMGKNSPMKYIERKRKGERVDYYFEDVDTGEKRLIIQYY